MFAQRLSSVAGAALAGVVAFGALHAAPPQSSCTPRSGYGQGDWDLPASSGGQGAVSGLFLIPNNPTFGMFFVATLTDVPSPCLSCIGGTIQGTLDDGIGPGPDYIVSGQYSGGWFSGNGIWTARIYAAASPQTNPVGRIRGIFQDPPANSGPGTFKSRWQICD